MFAKTQPRPAPGPRPDPSVITLTEYEIEVADWIGIRRHNASRQANRQNAHGYGGENALDVDAIGAQAEMALAKYLCLWWDMSVNTFHAPDLGGYIQVRVTDHQAGRLLIRQCDPVDHVYVLVIRQGHGLFRIAGQIYGEDARRPEWLTRPDEARTPCWAVPQEDLERVPRKREW